MRFARFRNQSQTPFSSARYLILYLVESQYELRREEMRRILTHEALHSERSWQEFLKTVQFPKYITFVRSKRDLFDLVEHRNTTNMSVSVGQDALARYRKMDKLGEGTYGLVYRARDLREGTVVAIKKIKLNRCEEGIPSTTLREVALLQHLKHPNIVEMSGVLYNDGELSLVFEFMDNDLKKYIDKIPAGQYLDVKTLKRFTYFLTEGMRHCHCRRVLHRDLKPQNILISDDAKQLKIADFGLGREHGLPIAELTHEVVTLWYRPPEILLGKPTYSGSADIWGIGCIMAEMATKLPLFAGGCEFDQLREIYWMMGTPNTETWPEVVECPAWPTNYKGPQWKPKDLGKELDHKLDEDGIDLLQKTLIYAPYKRITAKQMLLHQWFDEIREEMKAMFGDGFPHCGSPEYQYQRYLEEQNRRKEEAENDEEYNVEHENDVDEDDDYDDYDDDNDTDLGEDDVSIDYDEDDDDDLIQNMRRRQNSMEVEQ